MWYSLIAGEWYLPFTNFPFIKYWLPFSDSIHRMEKLQFFLTSWQQNAFPNLRNVHWVNSNIYSSNLVNGNFIKMNIRPFFWPNESRSKPKSKCRTKKMFLFFQLELKAAAIGLTACPLPPSDNRPNAINTFYHKKPSSSSSSSRGTSSK